MMFQRNKEVIEAATPDIPLAMTTEMTTQE
jgi:hypothetical protein